METKKALSSYAFQASSYQCQRHVIIMDMTIIKDIKDMTIIKDFKDMTITNNTMDITGH